MSHLTAPIEDCFSLNPFARKCEVLTDQIWIEMGIRRVLGNYTSGRSFLQAQVAAGELPVWTSLYFEGLKSQRRLDQIRWMNNHLISDDEAWENCQDPFSDCPELNDYVINIGDGHHHKAPVHEIKIDGKTYTTQHFYAQNARSGMIWPMTLAEYGDTRKKEHDMHALKRQDDKTLRANARKGQKSLWIWDSACMCFPQWHLWKMKGIYFLTVEKDLNEFKVIQKQDVDYSDQINAGVISDEKVESATKGIILRRVKYRCPDTGKTYSFVTNLNQKIRPGVIAFLYKCRWDIEKSYNTFKHKFGEKKAWAVSSEAKMTQALFISLTYNLSLILNRKIDKESSSPELSPNHTSKKKKRKRVKLLVDKAERLRRGVSSLLRRAIRLAEMPKKYLVWLNEVMRNHSPWNEAMKRLGIICRMNQ